MQRYFIPEANWEIDEVLITGQDAHHISRVMRKKIGDFVICNHPNGKAAKCQLAVIDKQTVKAKIIEWINDTSELPIHVTIAQGLPKGDKIEYVLQKGTELGAKEFIVYNADHTIVRWDHKKTEKKIHRFNKIVKEASEQSRRNNIPYIHPLANIDYLVEKSNGYDVKIFAYEDEAKTNQFHSLANELRRLQVNGRLFACIGPEGGFSEQEVHILKSIGFAPVRLGPRILRTETAALYLLSSISYHFEELGC
mgnify:CR=1 FL=1